MNAGRSKRWDSDDDSYDEDDGSYDDSQGYSEDGDEDEEYDEFVEREFGTNKVSSKLTRLQFWTTIVLLVSFTLPLLTYFFWAISQ
ncbi:MAG TPA: hypothetical protein DDZ51_25660 [Planctomycetaceae bacterium]|nr:hypothetical protein [Planctomycetaceae bacterium]